MSEILSQKAYAERCKVSPQAVSYWISQGMPRVGRGKIDPVAADAWRAELDPTKVRRRGQSTLDQAAEDPVPAGEQLPLIRPPAPTVGKLTEAKTRHTELQVETKELELQRLRGEVVPIAEAQDLIYTRARIERDMWLTWARDVPDLLAAELGTDRPKLRQALEREVRRQLADVSAMPLDVLERRTGRTLLQ